jgi:uncharacterized RDD family membrane protein YckC
VQYAGIVSRTVAFVLDALIVSVSLGSTTWFLVTIDSFLNLGLLTQVDDATRALIATILGGSTWFLLYHVIFLTFVGRTLGKAFMGLRVITNDGHRPSVWRAVLRVWAYFLSAMVLGLGFLWILVSDQRQGWHDKLAGTYVIYDQQVKQRIS